MKRRDFLSSVVLAAASVVAARALPAGVVLPVSPPGMPGTATWILSWYNRSGTVRQFRTLVMTDAQAYAAGCNLSARWCMYYCQLEKGAFPSTYIPTRDKPVTRECEHLHIPFDRHSRAGAPKFSRASSAWNLDENGVLRTYGVDAPRITTKGWLVEGTRTNVALWSEGRA